MEKLQFKQKCRHCHAIWVLVKHREPIVCDGCKKKQRK